MEIYSMQLKMQNGTEETVYNNQPFSNLVINQWNRQEQFSFVLRLLSASFIGRLSLLVIQATFNSRLGLYGQIKF